MRRTLMAAGTLMACAMASAAVAAPVPNGTVSSVALFNPTVTLSPTPSNLSTFSGGTFQVSGAGGFSKLAGTSGTLNGTVMFSNTPGTVITESLPNFFVFSDASGGTYNFSVNSVQTNSFVNNVGVFSSGTLYLLGSLIDANLNFTTPTPTSVSLQFNSTGGSAFASSLTLSTPAATAAVPEAATWAMMVVGVGMIGASLRRRRPTVTTRLAYS